MTRFIHDQFSKDYLEMLLSAYGSATAGQSLPSEIKEIDLFFCPGEYQLSLSLLGLLGQFCLTPCLFEPYRNPVTLEEVLDCVSKLLAVREDLLREAKRNKTRLSGGKTTVMDFNSYCKRSPFGSFFCSVIIRMGTGHLFPS
jgi:hypothetical protein